MPWLGSSTSVTAAVAVVAIAVDAVVDCGGVSVVSGVPLADGTGALAQPANAASATSATHALRERLTVEVWRTRCADSVTAWGGFQHLVVEYARNVVGVRDAEHAESSPDATTHVITPLTCSLFGQRMDVELRPGTRAFAAYGRPLTTERYHCNFGLNPAYVGQLERAGLVLSGVDQDGEVRILEHPTLRFFMGTLFVPQTTSSAEEPHPIVVALVEAAATRFNASNEPSAQTSTH